MYSSVFRPFKSFSGNRNSKSLNITFTHNQHNIFKSCPNQDRQKKITPFPIIYPILFSSGVNDHCAFILLLFFSPSTPFIKYITQKNQPSSVHNFPTEPIFIKGFPQLNFQILIISQQPWCTHDNNESQRMLLHFSFLEYFGCVQGKSKLSHTLFSCFILV